MSRVLVAIPCLLTGGTEIQTLSLVQALRQAAHEVHTVCYFEHAPAMVAHYEKAGATVHLLSPDGRRPQGVAQTVRHLAAGLRRTVRQVRPDAVHVQYMAPGAIPILILRALGVKKIVATAHTSADIYSPNGLKLVRRLSRRVLTAFQCITLRAEKSFFGSASLLTPETRFSRRGNHFTVYNNLPEYIEPKDPEAETEGMTPDPEQAAPGQITVGVVSRLEHIKGMDLVVPAFAALAGQIASTSRMPVRLLVVGDGSLRQSMERQARDLGVEHLTEFAGRQPQDALQGLYDRIDILLMPSRSEGFGLTAVEGMARGCVPVAADTGGLPEVVRDGTDGLLHEPGSAESLAAALLRLLTEPRLLARMRANAPRRARDFSQQQYNAQIKLLYENIGCP